MGDEKLLSGNSFMWLLVIGIIIVAIVILVLSRRDDAEPKEVQDKNDRNLLPYLIGVAAVALIVGVAWYYGLFSSDGAKAASSGVAASSASRLGSTRGMSAQQVNEERMAQSATRSASASPKAKSASPKSASPVRASSASASRSPPRGSLSSRSPTASAPPADE